MNEEKQIEEIAKILDGVCLIGGCSECEYYTLKHEEYACCDIKTAKALYTAGYRKASKVAREVIADLENGIVEYIKVYTEIRNREFMADRPTEYMSGKIDAYWSVKVRLAELKKKYTEGEG